MKSASKFRLTKTLALAGLLLVLVFTFTGCDELGFPPPEATSPAATPTPAEEPAPKAKSLVTTADTAILRVYEHLLELAESHQAKDYLAEFYAMADNWAAETELFVDGSSLWYVSVDMTDESSWAGEAHWQEAGWYILQSGDVMPAERSSANALRIEADLQRLSVETE